MGDMSLGRSVDMPPREGTRVVEELIFGPVSRMLVRITRLSTGLCIPVDVGVKQEGVRHVHVGHWLSKLSKKTVGQEAPRERVSSSEDRRDGG